jgi:sRNA-binding carbon storage regulator CsrA
MSLHLTRRPRETVVIRVGNEIIRVTVIGVDERNNVQLCFEARRRVHINREEVDILKFGKNLPPTV